MASVLYLSVCERKREEESEEDKINKKEAERKIEAFLGERGRCSS